MSTALADSTAPTPKAHTRLRLRVTPAAERAISSGHPWVFAESVREQNREGALGELAVLYDRRDRFMAIGLFDPESPLRVRVLHRGKPATIDDNWWRERLRAAFARREGLFDAHTTAYRLINGESDGWPGLVLDRYGTTFALKLYTAAWLPRLAAVAALIMEALAPGRLVLRLSRNIQKTAARFAVEDGSLCRFAANIGSGTTKEQTHDVAPPPKITAALTSAFIPAPAETPPAEFLETGLRFEADVVRGQKTGFFLDQRENRRRVEALAHGRDMLNTFSFSGGFSLYAARGGARSVTDLDISPLALAAARHNFALNHALSAIARCRHETIQADAFDWLEERAGPTFDLIVLDPPSLAKRESERGRALRAYTRLAAAGIVRLRRDGILVAASCSAHVTADEFFDIILTAARRSGRAFAEHWRSGHAPDHPATFPEAQYLKCICFALDGARKRVPSAARIAAG